MRPRSVLALGNFFAFAHFYLIVYILAPYLATFMSVDSVGLTVSLGAIVTLAIFPFLPRMVTRHGPEQMAMLFAALEGVALILLSLYPSPLAAVVLVAIACAVSPLIMYQLDLLLEACVGDESTTGRIRTAFITAGNFALILAPLAVGLLLDDSERYGRVFLAAALSTVPFMLLMMARSLPRVRVPRSRSLHDAYICIAADRDMRAIALSNFVLQFFFHLIPLYIPLYLHTTLGVPWSSLGWILGVSLIPFVLIEYPAGWLADTKLRDTVLLALGFVISGLSFASVSFITTTTPLAIILLIMVVLRIGSSLIESMTESHFFRRVSANDAETVTVFRMMRPLGAFTAPIIGGILLSIGSYAGLFTVTGLGIVILGLASVFLIHTRTTGKVRNVME